MKVEWHHDFDDEPVVWFSEIEAGLEVRKVEIYRDGKASYADATHSSGDTVLGHGIVPTVEEIGKQAEFTSTTVGQDVFETVWEQAVNRQ